MALAVVLAVVAVAPVATAEHEPVAHLEIVPANHQPGQQNTTYSAFAWRFHNAQGPVDMEQWLNITLVGPADGGSSCVIARDTRAAGVDRGNDDPGTETDESIVGKFKYVGQFRNEAGQHGITVQLYGEDDFGGQTIHLNHSDEAVAKVANCITNPSTPGWYRWFGHTNGTGYDGEYKEGSTYSHWFYICDCESHDAAVERIGPPPETGDGSGRTNYQPADQEPGRPRGPFDVAAPRPENGSSGDGSTPTVTATGTPTATATERPAAGGTATDVAVTTTGVATETATAAERQGATAAGGQSTGTTATGQTARETVATATDDGTHTSTGQPGFGLLPALAALVALAGYAVRRS